MVWQVKAALAGVALSGLVGFWLWDRHQQYEAGYNKAAVEYEKASTRATNQAISSKLDKLEESIRFSGKEAEIANERATELSNKIENMKVTLDDVTEYKQVASEMDCVKFGDDFFRLFNEPVKDARDTGSDEQDRGGSEGDKQDT